LLGDFATITTSFAFEVVLLGEGLGARLIELGRGTILDTLDFKSKLIVL